MPLQEGAPFQEPVPGQFVEGVGRPVAAHLGEQVVDEREGVGRVGAVGRLPRARVPSVGITCSRLAWTTPRSAPSRAHCSVVSWPPCRCRPSTHGCSAYAWPPTTATVRPSVPVSGGATGTPRSARRWVARCWRAIATGSAVSGSKWCLRKYLPRVVHSR